MSPRQPKTRASAPSTAQAAAPEWPCLLDRGDTCRLLVTVVPQARRTGADGLHDGALRVRLAAPPVDGKANEALLGWLSDTLNLPRRAVRLLHGSSARRKQLEIDESVHTVTQRLVQQGVLVTEPAA